MSPTGVSIITPTRNRERFLPHAYAQIRAQQWTDWEWLVDDDSPAPSLFLSSLNDSRVRYHHNPASRSVGVKRNDLVSRAQGELIAFFDDDDYYAPEYLAEMVNTLRQRNADFVKLAGYYLFSSVTGDLAYWNMRATLGLHFAWGGTDAKPVMLTPENNSGFIDNYLGYGFSYVFKRNMWGEAKFPDESGPEDAKFLKAAYKGRSVVCVDDQKGICLHVMHGDNLSFCYPQFFLPQFLLPRLFPGAMEYLKAISTPQAARITPP
jgi:glycosyltransferase involved in cell wall biosynthesis